MGKTMVIFRNRFENHWTQNPSVKEHLGSCDAQPTPEEVKIQVLERDQASQKITLETPFFNKSKLPLPSSKTSFRHAPLYPRRIE